LAATVLQDRTQEDFGNQELKHPMVLTVVEVLVVVVVVVVEGKLVLFATMDQAMAALVVAVVAKVVREEQVVTEAVAHLEFTST
jgi:hypothetical protein